MEVKQTPEPFTITYDEAIVDLSHVEALERAERLESTILTGKAVLELVGTRALVTAANVGHVVVRFGEIVWKDATNQ